MNPHILDGLTEFLDYVFVELHKRQLDVSSYELDHVCYRVASSVEYEARKTEMHSMGRLISEATINGRPIATFELHEPIAYRGRMIPLVEIPHPKPDRSEPSGLEHVEFVIDVEFEALLKKYSSLTFDLSGIHKAHNPEIILRLQKATIKFHRESLKDVISKESPSIALPPDSTRRS